MAKTPEELLAELEAMAVENEELAIRNTALAEKIPPWLSRLRPASPRLGSWSRMAAGRPNPNREPEPEPEPGGLKFVKPVRPYLENPGCHQNPAPDQLAGRGRKQFHGHADQSRLGFARLRGPQPHRQETGRVTLVNFRPIDNAVIFGFKCRGMQPKSLTWQDMKFGSVATGSLADDKSWDDKHLKIQGSINGIFYAEDFASYDSMDGIDTGDVGTQTHHCIMQSFYARGNRDDFIQNDQLKAITCRDFLIDGCHFFVSVRPGGGLSAYINMYFHNGLIRLGRNTYFAGQNPGTSNPNPQSLYSDYWTSPDDRGIPEKSNNQQRGYAHNQVIKDFAGFKGEVIMEDCFVLMESKPLGGQNDPIWPRGRYKNVTYGYVGETPANFGPTPNG